MTSYYHAIETSRLNEKPVLCAMAKRNTIHLDSPAVELMEDFTSIKPVNLSDAMPYEKVREFLFDTHSSYAFVTNQQKKVIGFIPIEDLLGLHAMARANECNLKLRELSARDLMEPILSLPVASMDEVARSKVGDILHTFRHQVEDFLVVTESESPAIRGLFSARALTQALGLSSETRFQARTVSDLAQIINGHYSRI